MGDREGVRGVLTTDCTDDTDLIREGPSRKGEVQSEEAGGGVDDLVGSLSGV